MLSDEQIKYFQQVHCVYPGTTRAIESAACAERDKRIAELEQRPAIQHKRAALTEQEIDKLIARKHFHSGYALKASDMRCLAWYKLGLRDGEEAHGIKE